MNLRYWVGSPIGTRARSEVEFFILSDVLCGVIVNILFDQLLALTYSVSTKDTIVDEHTLLNLIALVNTIPGRIRISDVLTIKIFGDSECSEATIVVPD